MKVKKFLIFLIIILLVSLSFLLKASQSNYIKGFFNETIKIKSNNSLKKIEKPKERKTILSDYDCNNNGIDDFTDFVIGARKEVEANTQYVEDRGYYFDINGNDMGGYPPEGVGVCADTIWRVFLEAGYIFRDMVDEDIANNIHLYPGVNEREEGRDKYIDFRRVRNLKVFLDRHFTSLTLDPYDVLEWNPGDIVIFGETYDHIGIISDKFNEEGIPYLIHNSDELPGEQDIMIYRYEKDGITGHYRFDDPKDHCKIK